LKEPELVILDEATSALDSESEYAVQQAFERLLAAKSCIVIAHRLSTVMNADQILVLREGRIIERGHHHALSVKPGGLYAKLFSIQSRGRLGELPL
jgi:subfamily B ATP-binding cassette protein MsbA